MFSSPRPCGWLTLDWNCRGWSSGMKTSTRPSTEAYLVCGVYQHFAFLKCFFLFLLLVCSCETLLDLGFPLSDAFSQIIANEGVGTLWSSTLPSLILVLNPAVQFTIYEAMKRKAGKGGRRVSRIKNCSVVCDVTSSKLMRAGRIPFKDVWKTAE